jgi:large subunit ribosomal protein L9
MEVLLLQTVSGIGRKGDVKNVKEGYFKNFLLPKKLAIVATEGKIKEAGKLKEMETIQKGRLLDEAKEVAKRLNGLTVTFKSKAKGDKLYGSISEKDIIAAIKEKENVELEKSHLKMSEHLKVVGTYEIPVHITDGAEAKVTVEIKGEE